MNSIKSPVRWMTDNQYQNAAIGQRAIAHADSQVGILESGPNQGQRVEEYQEISGLRRGGGYPWCACFVYWILVKSGTNPKFLPAVGACAAVRNWIKWAKSNSRRIQKPHRGALFYWLNQDQTGHIGFCLGPTVLGIFRTIEGNTDREQGSREGDGVYKRTRTLWQLKSKHQFGFISLENL
jgi:hypothetical protein